MTLVEDMKWLEEQPTVGSCVFCPGVLFHGTAREVWEMQADHRRQTHPDLKRTRRKKQHLGTWRQMGMDAEEEAEVFAEVERRRKLNGL